MAEPAWKPPLEWHTDLATRVGHFGLGAWLADLGTWMRLPAPLPPKKAERFHEVRSPLRPVSLRLHDPEWEHREFAEPDEWVLYDATITIDDDLILLPFDLSPTSETPESAMAKISLDATANGPLKPTTEAPCVTYFLKDHRAVIITFRKGLVGIQQVGFTRLYDWPDWRLVNAQK